MNNKGKTQYLYWCSWWCKQKIFKTRNPVNVRSSKVFVQQLRVPAVIQTWQAKQLKAKEQKWQATLSAHMYLTSLILLLGKNIRSEWLKADFNWQLWTLNFTCIYKTVHVSHFTFKLTSYKDLSSTSVFILATFKTPFLSK